MDFVFFLGRFHVLVLHLPIGIILVTIALEFAARNDRYARFESAAPLLWATAAVTAIVTVALGYMHYAEGGYEEGNAGNLHRILGTALAVVTTIVWILRTRSEALYAKARLSLAIVLIILVFTTGHYGGSLTHGSSYLFGAVGDVTINPDGNIYGGEPSLRRVQKYVRVRP